MKGRRCFRFKGFTLDLTAPALHRGAQKVPLRHQCLKVLAHLADRSGEVVSHKELIEINADFAEAHAELGRVMIELGFVEKAIERIDEAIRLSTTNSAALSWCQLWAGLAMLHAGNYESALDRLLRAEQANPANEDLPPWLALAYAGVGRQDKARAMMGVYLRRKPGFTLAGWKRDHWSDNAVVAAQRERIAEMLRDLGVPDGEVRTSVR